MIRITIVEDESFMREELSLILEKAGYEVYEVQTFQKTYEEILKSHKGKKSVSCDDSYIQDTVKR